MQQLTPPTVRRTAAIGTTAALVAVASMIGIGIGAPAVADTGDGGTSSVSTPGATPTSSPGREASASPGPTTPTESTAPASGASAPTPTRDPSSLAELGDTGTTTADAVPVAAADAAPVAWSEPSSAEDRIVLDASAGTPFSHTFAATGGSGPLEYLFNGHFLLPDTITWDEQTGVISGTFPASGSYDLEVAATDQHDTATQWVRIDVAAAPGEAAVGIIVGVTDTSAAEPSVWAVAADGSTTHSDSPEVQSGDPTVPLRVPQDHALHLNPLLVDRSDRVTFPTRVTWTSTVASDTFTEDAEGEATTLTFAHASPHVITARSGDVSVSFTVTVDPLDSTAVATPTPTPTAAASLAFTGPEHTRGMLAWAIGLLAAGGGALGLRLRRRA